MTGQATLDDASQIPAWVSRLHSVNSREVVEITKTLELLWDRLKLVGYDVSKDLDMVDVEKAHLTHLLACLRMLFTQRGKIPGWYDLEQRTRDEFYKRDLDPVPNMAGLNVDRIAQSN